MRNGSFLMLVFIVLLVILIFSTGSCSFSGGSTRNLQDDGFGGDNPFAQ